MSTVTVLVSSQYDAGGVDTPPGQEPPWFTIFGLGTPAPANDSSRLCWSRPNVWSLTVMSPMPASSGSKGRSVMRASTSAWSMVAHFAASASKPSWNA